MPYFFHPGTYVFGGSYFEEDSIIPLPVEGRFTVEGNSEILRIEGTWQQHSGRPKHPFTMELTSKGLEGFLGRAKVSFAAVSLDGWISTIPDGLCGAGRDDAGNCVSIQTLRTKPNVHTAQGLILLNDRKAGSFSFMIGPFDPKVALENVVSLRGGKRA